MNFLTNLGLWFKMFTGVFALVLMFITSALGTFYLFAGQSIGLYLLVAALCFYAFQKDLLRTLQEEERKRMFFS